ncbi:MAG: protease inhibitor I9 family protein, partial [Anaerolineae bacterium]
PVTLPTETVTAYLTENGKVIVIIFLKEQPLQVASREVRDEFEPRLEALSTQFRAILPNPWEGQSLTEEQEHLAVTAAPSLSAAQQEELDFLNTQMDALNTEMRREMMARAMPFLEESQAQLSQAIEDLGGQVLYQYNILNGIAAAIPPAARADIEARPDVAEVVNDQRMSGHLDVSVPTSGANTW